MSSTGTKPDFGHDTIVDYARDLERLVLSERERTARVLDRIDRSMAVLYESRNLVRGIE